jgi:hypothetical protein
MSMKDQDDDAGMEHRMDAIRLKHMLGGVLTEQELMCLQIEGNGFGCMTCRRQEPPSGSASEH